MRGAWEQLNESVGAPESAGFVVQSLARPGVPLSLESLEDPLFGPIISFGVQGAPSELLGDRSYRIPPLTDTDAAAMVREIKSAPLLLGYRGSDVVDIAVVEELLLRLAQLKNELHEVASLNLDLVLAGAHGRAVLDASARVAPASRTQPSDGLVRRMARPRRARRHQPRLSRVVSERVQDCVPCPTEDAAPPSRPIATAHDRAAPVSEPHALS
jgi:acyl-CoA synthetase (NDP forming)